MDYSAHDSDLPGGEDPWASSPKHNRQSYNQPPTTDIPSSPLPAQASPYGQDSEQYGYMGDHDAQNRPSTASENGDHAQAPQVAGQDAPQSQQQPQAQQQAPAHGQQPQRYHGTRPQGHRAGTERQEGPDLKVRCLCMLSFVQSYSCILEGRDELEDECTFIAR
jgi:hypothetical protein